MSAPLSPAVREFLQKPNFAVLVTRAPSNRLQATPVWFDVVDGQILINTSQGRAKLRNLRRDPDVALAIVDRENPYRYVQIQGKAVRFDTEHGARDIDRLSQRYTHKPYGYPGGDQPEKRVSIYIEAERITGL